MGLEHVDGIEAYWGVTAKVAVVMRHLQTTVAGNSWHHLRQAMAQGGFKATPATTAGCIMFDALKRSTQTRFSGLPVGP
jgi:hypothetical protein